jgi:hypothetical protein
MTTYVIDIDLDSWHTSSNLVGLGWRRVGGVEGW